MFSTIQGKNTFSITALVVFFLAILLLFNYFLLRDYSLENADRTSQIILNSADSQLEIIFNEMEAIVTALATLRAVREVDVEDMSELFINNVLVRNDIVRAIYLGTRDGRMYEWGVGEGFHDFKPDFPIDYDPRVRPWYRLAVDTESYGLTLPYIFASVEALGITAVIPVYEGEEIMGVLGLDLILQGLDNLVNSLHVPMEGKVILLNRNKEILVNQFFPTTGRVTEMEIFPFPELVQHINGFVIDDVYGDRYMISNVENKATGWTMLLFLPYAEIMDFSLHMILIIIVIDLVLIFLLGIIITILTRYLITNPLDKIIAVLRVYERGDLSARIPPLNGKEFHMMGRLFNRLIDLSLESSQQLEEMVEERTKAVIRLQKENLRLRIIEEKEQIYENLHDSLGARLTSINISNHVAKSAFERQDTEVLPDIFNRIETNTMQGIQDLKEILQAGQEEGRPFHDFHHYIEKIVKDRLKLKEIILHSSLPDPKETEDLESEWARNCERLIQELVSNTMKHSHATEVRILLKREEQVVLLDYADNGIGFVLKEALTNGFGIQGLYSRVERVGGVLKITAKPGNGAKFSFKFRIH